MAKKQTRVRNWTKYNEALVQRGSVTFWLDEKMLSQWQSRKRRAGRGRPEYYSDVAIESVLILKCVFKLTLRSAEGFVNSVLALRKYLGKVPDYTTLCKRQKGLPVEKKLSGIAMKEGIVLVVDSSGLKVWGEGEWRVRMHGKTKQRSWRKIHIGLNAQTQEIEAAVLTRSGIEDCQGLDEVLKKVHGKLKTVIGDGAYDRSRCYEAGERYGCEVIFPPQRNAATSEERQAQTYKASREVLRKRDEVVRAVRRLGRDEWKRRCGYHRRSLGETVMYRFKHLLGERLNARLVSHQTVELHVKCLALNKMTQLGLPTTLAN